MPRFDTVTGQGTPPGPADGSFEDIQLTQQAELEAPDPDAPWLGDTWDEPPTSNNNLGGGGGGYTPPTNPTAETPPTTEVETPPPPVSTEPPLVKTGLGDKVDDVINRSPTLRKQWAEAQAKGWKIEIVPYGSGSKADPNKTRIFIDEQDLAKGGHDLASLLSHEIGHAAEGFPPPVDPNTTRDDYVSKDVKQRMEHEGSAAFENARARDEIMYTDGKTEDGPDIGIRGKFDDEYIAIYERFKNGEISEEQAKTEMTEVMSREPAGVNPDGTYITKKELATQESGRDWDQQHAPPTTP